MNRNVNDLDPAVRFRWMRVLAKAKEKGLKVIVTSTVRTRAEQDALWAQGREELEDVNDLRQKAGLYPLKNDKENYRVTYTKESIHLYGCALDFALARADGGIHWDVKADVNDNEIPDYTEVGMIAESEGFTWGGRFPKKDLCHIEYTGGLSRAQLRAGMRPSDNKGG